MDNSKKLWLLVVLALIASLLIATPILSQDSCTGEGETQACDQPAETTNAPETEAPVVEDPAAEPPAPENSVVEDEGMEEPAVEAPVAEEPVTEAAPVEDTSVQSAPNQSEELLGCQRNNPDRLDCSSLEVSGVCEGNVALFTIRNTGEAGNGDMLAGTSYRLYVDGVLVESGTVQLTGGATMQISWSGGGSVTLEADQQVGHPGSSHPRSSLNCGVATEVPTTEAPTEEPTTEVPTTEAPTEEPTTEVPTEEPTTEVPTEPADDPNLIGDVICVEDGSTRFTVTNIGGDMTAPAYYYVVDVNGWTESEGTIQLAAGQSVSINGSAGSAMAVEGWFVLYSDCGAPTEQPFLIGDVTCDGVTGTAVYTITNTSTVDMSEYVYWYIIAADGSFENSGYLLLAAGQSTVIYGSGGSALGVDGWFALYAQCTVPTEPPTEEPTEAPTEPPTEEPTEVPTEPPTEEPTQVPTEAPTEPPSDEVLGCQKNNPDRLDCSSLEVTGVCVGNVAVFTITNTGEAGNGDMRAPTEYRLYVNNVLVETGFIDLDGETTVEITYEGGGRVRLEADQQIGHPGNSRPRATLNCGR